MYGQVKLNVVRSIMRMLFTILSSEWIHRGKANIVFWLMRHYAALSSARTLSTRDTKLGNGNITKRIKQNKTHFGQLCCRSNAFPFEMSNNFGPTTNCHFLSKAPSFCDLLLGSPFLLFFPFFQMFDPVLVHNFRPETRIKDAVKFEANRKPHVRESNWTHMSSYVVITRFHFSRAAD